MCACKRNEAERLNVSHAGALNACVCVYSRPVSRPSAGTHVEHGLLALGQ